MGREINMSEIFLTQGIHKGMYGTLNFQFSNTNTRFTIRSGTSIFGETTGSQHIQFKIDCTASVSDPIELTSSTVGTFLSTGIVSLAMLNCYSVPYPYPAG